MSLVDKFLDIAQYDHIIQQGREQRFRELLEKLIAEEQAEMEKLPPNIGIYSLLGQGSESVPTNPLQLPVEPTNDLEPSTYSESEGK